MLLLEAILRFKRDIEMRYLRGDEDFLSLIVVDAVFSSSLPSLMSYMGSIMFLEGALMILSWAFLLNLFNTLYLKAAISPITRIPPSTPRPPAILCTHTPFSSSNFTMSFKSSFSPRA